MAGFSFEGSVARRYDDLLVPRLFGPWAQVLVGRLGLRDGESVLDVACGTGAAARVAAAEVGPEGRVVAADESPQMIAQGSSRASGRGEAPISWIACPAAQLAVPDATFHACTCQQGLQFFPDRAAALAEMRRALEPGGRLAVSVWAEPSPPFPGLVDVLRQVEPEVAARANAPWAWTDGAALERAVREAGFQDVSLEVRELPYRWEGGVDQAIEGLHGTPIGPMLWALPAARHEAVLDAWRHRLAAGAPDGGVAGVARSNVVTAVR
jgi:ubiquinone/menaquinone biosynthesis C-methylase UbiE